MALVLFCLFKSLLNAKEGLEKECEKRRRKIVDQNTDCKLSNKKSIILLFLFYFAELITTFYNQDTDTKASDFYH